MDKADEVDIPGTYKPWKRALNGKIITSICEECGAPLICSAILRLRKRFLGRWSPIEVYCLECGEDLEPYDMTFSYNMIVKVGIKYGGALVQVDTETLSSVVDF